MLWLSPRRRAHSRTKLRSRLDAVLIWPPVVSRGRPLGLGPDCSKTYAFLCIRSIMMLSPRRRAHSASNRLTFTSPHRRGISLTHSIMMLSPRRRAHCRHKPILSPSGPDPPHHLLAACGPESFILQLKILSKSTISGPHRLLAAWGPPPLNSRSLYIINPNSENRPGWRAQNRCFC